jgi:hypothetical protein
VTGPDGETTLTLPDHVPLLEAKIVAIREAGRPVGMVVIDPIGAFLSQGTDTHRDASVRSRRSRRWPTSSISSS